MCVTSIMCSLILSEICDTALEESVKTELSTEVFKELFELANKHDVAHIVASALSKAGLLGEDEFCAAFKKALMIAIYRDAQREYTIQLLTQALEQNEVPYIPLKGTFIRNYYPHTWLRTSCDIDILVNEVDLDKMVHALTSEYGFSYYKKGTHDVSLFSENKNHIEFHFDLVEGNSAKLASNVLQKVWSATYRHAGYKYWFDMSDEMFYFYHIAHMAKHFEFGGCGIRPFIDLWILNHKISFDKVKRDKLLAEGELLTFAKQAELLTEIWFGSAQHTEISRQMQEYILRGGVYGTTKNRIAVQQQKQGGKLNYIISRAFISYDEMKTLYPILEKHRWLTPIMQLRRWGRITFCGYFKQTAQKIKYNNAISNDVAESTHTLLKNIGL